VTNKCDKRFTLGRRTLRILKNCWYAAAWSSEVTHGVPLARRIANMPVLFFRRTDGEMAGIADYCPHRYAPLHRGKQLGDVIQCGYHGLQFNDKGRCAHNPHPGPLPTQQIPAYSVVDRYSVIWIWIGDQTADPSLINEEFAFLSDPRRAHVRGRFHVKANYQLLLDNLLDISHARYLHGDALMTEEMRERYEPRTAMEDGVVVSRLEQKQTLAPGLFSPALPAGTVRVDFYDYVKGILPSVVSHDIVYCQPGADKYLPSGVSSRSAHLFTPETNSTSHYLFDNSRDFMIEDKATDDRVMAALQQAFGKEDIPMIEAQQQLLGDTDLLELKPVVLANDRASMLMRRRLAKMIREQEGPSVSAVDEIRGAESD
jgi:phenylpropionate dioxygenase-like ring-hydroxylating dioxygenase large terminal subunit